MTMENGRIACFLDTKVWPERLVVGRILDDECVVISPEWDFVFTEASTAHPDAVVRLQPLDVGLPLGTQDANIFGSHSCPITTRGLRSTRETEEQPTDVDAVDWPREVWRRLDERCVLSARTFQWHPREPVFQPSRALVGGLLVMGESSGLLRVGDPNSAPLGSRVLHGRALVDAREQSVEQSVWSFWRGPVYFTMELHDRPRSRGGACSRHAQLRVSLADWLSALHGNIGQAELGRAAALHE